MMDKPVIDVFSRSGLIEKIDVIKSWERLRYDDISSFTCSLNSEMQKSKVVCFFGVCLLRCQNLCGVGGLLVVSNITDTKIFMKQNSAALHHRVTA